MTIQSVRVLGLVDEARRTCLEALGFGSDGLQCFQRVLLSRVGGVSQNLTYIPLGPGGVQILERW